MYDVICIGSATVDCFISTGNKLFQKTARRAYVKVPFGTKILVEQMQFSTGGGGSNTAVGFARLGFKAALISKMGLGTNSERIYSELQSEKVDTSMLIRKKGLRTAFSVVLDASGKDRTILAFKGSNNDLRSDEINKSRLKTKWFYFSSMVDRSFDVLEDLSEFALKHNISIAFNPSSYIAVKGANYMKKVLRATTVLVLNRGEACELLGKSYATGIDMLLKGLYSRVPRLVAVTDGKNGVYAYDGEVKYYLKPSPVKVVEATGAGDAFACGFVGGIMMGKSIEDALRMGSANSESVIQYFGAKNNLLSRKEISKYLSHKLKKVEKGKLA